MPTEKLYSPLEFYLHNTREEEESVFGLYDLYDERCKIPHEEAFQHMDAIELAIRRDRDRMDSGIGLAEYVPESLSDIVVSLFPKIELHDDWLWCVAEVGLDRPITPGEMGELTQWWSGQLSDGWGEGFEQREIKVGSEELYVVPWTSDEGFFIATQSQFDNIMEEWKPTTQETPAQAALHEPGIFDADIDCVDTSTHMSMLTDRVNANYTEYIDGLRDKDEITDYSAEIATISEAHYYITQRHNFHFSELDYLLQFKNPLLVVAEAFDANRDEEHSDIMWKIFHEQEALQGDYERVPIKETADEIRYEELQGVLNARLDDNLAEMLNDLRSDIADHLLSNGEVTEIAGKITAVDVAHTYLTNTELTQEQMEYLLRFEYPLELVSDRWTWTSSGLVDMNDVVSDILADKSSHGQYKRFEDTRTPETTSAARPVVKTEEKPSVLARIREAAKMPRESHKDKPTRDKSGPEL